MMMKSYHTPYTIVDRLCTEKPSLHNNSSGQLTNFALNRPALDWLAANLHPTLNTLETGAGYSTIVFLNAGCQHTVISPSPNEHTRIRQWCVMHEVAIDHLTFHEVLSQSLLPNLDLSPLDVVLIDGAHP
jgi:hypothetical protein